MSLTPKQQLEQVNNPNLLSILSTIQGLPLSNEDVTPEVTAQTPLVTQIAENLGVTITTPSGTNKQILQGNNANLQTINTNFAGTQVKTVTPTTAGLEVTPDDGYLLSGVTVAGDNDLIAENIKSGVDIFGVTGTMESYNVKTFNGSSALTTNHLKIEHGLNMTPKECGITSLSDGGDGSGYSVSADDTYIHVRIYGGYGSDFSVTVFAIY